MANNELSGLVVTAALARWLASLPERHYTYRIVFVPETIGAILYLSRTLEHLRATTIAGFVITCVGDDRSYSFLPSRLGNTLADRVATYVLDHMVGNYDIYSFLDRGSDERQYCSPLVDLPVVSIMRSKYATYPEYHTSLDNMSFISETGLRGAFYVLRRCIEVLEANETYLAVFPCEPQLGKRGLYPTISMKSSGTEVRTMMNLLAYADGRHDLLAIAERIGADVLDCAAIAERLQRADLVRATRPSSNRGTFGAGSNSC